VTITVLRTAERWWVRRGTQAFPVDADVSTTAALMTKGLMAVRAAHEHAVSGEPVEGLLLVSPITSPCRIVAQAVNYRSHARDTGFGNSSQTVFFRKSSASLSGPTDDVVLPSHVRLLDYEVELGLVMGRALAIGTTVTDQDLSHYVAGVVMCDDVSARDVQLADGKFYESKSYPTFTPTGPHLVLLDPADLGRLSDLRLRLWVNGQLRQDQTVADMITPPAAALTQLARFQMLDPGDLVLTGTPGGTALHAPPVIVTKVGALLPSRLKWHLFISGEERKPEYLRAGDLVTASIATADGALDLGTQRTIVRNADD
jgi:2-keto-4-pentenoate hydratase/2-oxohepta-3-ene-1,7-dioic acid hydratase in catechol pathway